MYARRLALAALFLLTTQAAAQGGSQRPAVRAATGAIHVDGVLREPVWNAADSIVALTQTEPREGEPASARTVVRVVAERDALVIGVRASQPANVPIISFARERDNALTNE